MYGGFITPPNDSGAHFGVLFYHRDGFSTACGHGTIALGFWAIANGLVKTGTSDTVDVVIDVPSGRVIARATMRDGAVLHVDFVNVASYMISNDKILTVGTNTGNFALEIELVFGGAVYACVDVVQLGLRVEPANCPRFVDYQRQIKAQMADFLYLERYDIFGVCFFEHISDNEQVITQRNVIVFGDGGIDRSPTGSCTCARLGSLLAQGKVSKTKRLINESILRTKFEAFVDNVVSSPTSFPACIPRVRGTARLVGRMDFYIDPDDPLYPGFLLL